jgi:predicted ATP-grasp superfamily ATP-dependent carboligase
MNALVANTKTAIGSASKEFIVDDKDSKPKIIDVNPWFYGPLQCAITTD